MLIARGTQRRRALGDDAEPLDILVGEEQIVRTGFDRHVDAPRPRLGRHRDAAAGADVDDVQAGAGFLREQERTLDRLELGDDRPRVEEGPRGPRRDALAETARQLLALGVHGDRQPEPRRFAQAVEQRDVVGARETRAGPSRT